MTAFTLCVKKEGQLLNHFGTMEVPLLASPLFLYKIQTGRTNSPFTIVSEHCTSKLYFYFLSHRPYGNPACNDCKGFCCGHYMMPEEYFGRHSDVTFSVSPPPTEQTLKKLLLKYSSNKMRQDLNAYIQKMLMLLCLDIFHFFLKVSMWFEHLQTVQQNSKRGASKAAKTRKQRRLDKRRENQNSEVRFCNFQCI